MFLRFTSSWHSRGNSNDVSRGRVFHSNSVGSPWIPQKLFRNCCLNFHQLSFPSQRRLCWFRNFSKNIRRNLRTHGLLLLPTWPWIITVNGLYIQSLVIIFPAPISEQCWTNTWSLPHTRSWTFCCTQHPSVQDEQLLSLKMTWIIPTSVCSSLPSPTLRLMDP